MSNPKRELKITIEGGSSSGKTTMAALLVRLINGQTLHNVSMEQGENMSDEEWDRIVEGARKFDMWIDKVDHVEMKLETKTSD